MEILSIALPEPDEPSVVDSLNDIRFGAPMSEALLAAVLCATATALIVGGLAGFGLVGGTALLLLAVGERVRGIARLSGRRRGWNRRQRG